MMQDYDSVIEVGRALVEARMHVTLWLLSLRMTHYEPAKAALKKTMLCWMQWLI